VIKSVPGVPRVPEVPKVCSRGSVDGGRELLGEKLVTSVRESGTFVDALGAVVVGSRLDE